MTGWQIGPLAAAIAQPLTRHPGHLSFARRFAPRSSVAAGTLGGSCAGRAALPSGRCLRENEDI